MRPYKAVITPPFEQSVWHGMYYFEGRWHVVQDADGEIIVYPTAKAASDQAKLIVDELQQAEGQ